MTHISGVGNQLFYVANKAYREETIISVWVEVPLSQAKEMSNRRSETLKYWMVWNNDEILAVIKIEMVTEALKVDQCAEWEEKVAQERL